VVRAFDSQDFVGREARSAHVEAGATDGPYRLRGASDTVWPSQGYSKREGIGARLGDTLAATTRMILPVIFLCMSIAAMYLYMDRTLPYFADAQGRWLTVSHLLLPLAFLAVHLTNRRYGPSYAFAQIVISLALCSAIVMFGSEQLRQFLPTAVVPSLREGASFAGAFFVAGFLAIIAFDGARGPRWWIAPLLASLIGGLTFVLIFYPATYAGTGTEWTNHMVINSAILVVAAVVGIVPYWFLRRAIPPLPGFGGY
jgi:uncharacterized PurR-regulated membrane protein YhhQ (DUF165 family)